MSTVAQSFVTWSDFQRWPERSDEGCRYELHNGEVVTVPPPKPRHKKLQKQIETVLQQLAGDRGIVAVEHPYRPLIDLQFWYADVAYIPRGEWDALPDDHYPAYAPPLIIEVLSPSNTSHKLNTQRLLAMSAGTKEFWIVDPAARTVEVTTLESHKLYQPGDHIDSLLGSLPLDDIFAI